MSLKNQELLEEINKKEREEEGENEMEITWEVGLKETAEEMVKRKKSEKERKELTPWENYLNERKQKKKRKQQAKPSKDRDRLVKFPIQKICLRRVLPRRLLGHS